MRLVDYGTADALFSQAYLRPCCLRQTSWCQERSRATPPLPTASRVSPPVELCSCNWSSPPERAILSGHVELFAQPRPLLRRRYMLWRNPAQPVCAATARSGRDGSLTSPSLGCASSQCQHPCRKSLGLGCWRSDRRRCLELYVGGEGCAHTAHELRTQPGQRRCCIK